MKIIPRRILKMTAISTKPNNLYGAVIESKNKSVTLTGTMKENADPVIFNELINKYAYASALLYFVENFEIEDVNKNDLLEDINILLHSRCRVVNEKAPLITSIGDYPLYEGENYILRGKGNNKIKESFNLNEDIDISEITPEFLNNREYDDVIKGFIVCPKCKNVFDEDALITDYPNIPDDYDGPIDDDPISYNCPYCNYYTKNSENFSDAWVDDLEDAPNKDEYLSNDLNESEKLTKSQVKLKIQKLKHLCMDIQKDIAKYKFGRGARVGCDFDESGDISDNRIRIETDYVQDLDPDYVTQSISDIVKSYIPEAKLDDIQIRTRNHTKYNYKTHKDTVKTEGIRTCYYIVPKTINEEAGTQAADIAGKVDYSFQSAPTPANPKRKKIYEKIDIKDLDDEDTLNLTGFIKGVDGLYRRGSYVVVKECETGNLKVIHKSKLNEEVDIVDETAGPEKIVDYLKEKLDEKFPNRFQIKSGPVDDAFGLVITDNSNHDAGDLIDVTDVINAVMENLQYSKEDYEIDYKKNNLIVAIYNPK